MSFVRRACNIGSVYHESVERNLVGASRMDRVRNEEECIRAGIETELVIEQIRVCDGLGMWKEWLSTVLPKEC